MWSRWTLSRRPGKKLVQSRGISQEGTSFLSLCELSPVFSPFLTMLSQWRDSSMMDAQSLMALTSQSPFNIPTELGTALVCGGENWNWRLGDSLQVGPGFEPRPYLGFQLSAPCSVLSQSTASHLDGDSLVQPPLTWALASGRTGDPGVPESCVWVHFTDREMITRVFTRERESVLWSLKFNHQWLCREFSSQKGRSLPSVWASASCQWGNRPRMVGASWWWVVLGWVQDICVPLGGLFTSINSVNIDPTEAATSRFSPFLDEISPQVILPWDTSLNDISSLEPFFKEHMILGLQL